jgi:hypothetical protein
MLTTLGGPHIIFGGWQKNQPTLDGGILAVSSGERLYLRPATNCRRRWKEAQPNRNSVIEHKPSP